MNRSIIAALSLTLIFLLGNLQTTQAQSSLPVSGDKTFEVMVAPFSGSPISFNQFRLRMFRSQDMALRARGDIGYTSNKFDEDNKSTSFDITLAPGVEWHFVQDERYSVYYGTELALGLYTTRQHTPDNTNKNVNGNENFSVALNAVAGIDFHFLERLYAGIEVGYGLSIVSYLDQEVGGTVTENDQVDTMLGRFAPSQFRLGFTF